MSNLQTDAWLEALQEDLDEAKAKYDDLRVQAMMFDLDIDIETWSLIPKKEHKEEVWLIKWKKQQDARDYATDDYNE